MKKDLLDILKEHRVKVPNKFFVVFMRAFFFLITRKARVKYYYHDDFKPLKNKPMILLCDHSSRDNFYYVFNGWRFTNPNALIGYQNIFAKGFFKLLLHSGVIPKSLYEADMNATRNMLKVISMGGSLCIFPEGIQSTSGSTHPMNPATLKLIKKVQVPVVLCKSYGGYFCHPRYVKYKFQGRQEYHYEYLFTQEEIANSSIDELYEKYKTRIAYNDFTWNEDKHYKYKSKHQNIEGLDKIIYRCPKCGSEFNFEIKDNRMKCLSCNNEIEMDESFDIHPVGDSYLPYKNIDEWFKDQRKEVIKELKEKDINITYECDLYDIYTKKLLKDPYYCVGTGTFNITKEKLTYKGTRNGEDVELVFNVSATPSIPFTPGQDNDLYYGGKYHCFRPLKDKNKVVKYMLYVEEAHNLLDSAWNKTSRDVYD